MLETVLDKLSRLAMSASPNQALVDLSVRPGTHPLHMDQSRGRRSEKESYSRMRRLTTVIAAAGALSVCIAVAVPLGTQAATPMPPPRPPFVYTGTFPEVGTASATLKGGVNSHGTETSYSFQYGLTTTYGAQTPPAPAGNGTVEVKVSQAITGLQPASTYHYRLVATSAAGTTNGQDVAFTTKKIPLIFKVSATPNPDVFGSPFSVSGVLSGTGAVGHEIVLQANPFPYLGGFKDTGNSKVTDPNGGFSFPVTSLLENTQFRVATVETPTVNSPIVAERLAVRVSLHPRPTGRHGSVRLYGAVEPAEVGALVVFQLLRPGLRPLSVGSTLVWRATSSASRFSRVVRIRRGGLYRALVQVGNGRQVSGHSRAVLIR
jgi:hypothetical protein